MSRTKRKDQIDIDGPRPDYVHVMYVGHAKPTVKEKRRAHMDKKKGYKPSRHHKESLSKGSKAKMKHALDQVVSDPEGAVLPREVKTHRWDFN